MILSEAEIQNSLKHAQAEFPSFHHWQYAYLWSSADLGCSHLVDSDPCDSVAAGIASLKSKSKSCLMSSLLLRLEFLH